MSHNVKQLEFILAVIYLQRSHYSTLFKNNKFILKLWNDDRKSYDIANIVRLKLFDTFKVFELVVN